MPLADWESFFDEEMVEELKHTFNLKTKAELEALFDEVAMDIEQLVAERTGTKH
ncbi:hypothetical protein [Mesorhizobium ventifaucium]|uniref:Uncharacterized protein n=1 Tax=Mesorhizobium ventifaucium TaxID=666020 RepID=A0ABM9EFF2_9HYPH|nr:hypothetical protein [Mesorhizobium ventifaucium]CAH2408038.1 hypothetical protein MES4922_90028 [Mesorhizobium ventifaucium]